MNLTISSPMQRSNFNMYETLNKARGGADVKVGTAEKVSKVREDKAR